ALMGFGTRQDQCIGRGAELEIGAVQLEAGRPTARQPEIAEDLVIDTVEDPGGARIGGARHAAVIRAFKQALRREADPAKDLRRPAIAPPQAAISAVEGLKILAGFGRPGPNATLGAVIRCLIDT